MYITNGCDIIVPRGDRADIPFIFTDKDTGDTVIFDTSVNITLDVFPVRGEESVISKTVPAWEQYPDGTVVFHLRPADTDVPFGEYHYTLRAVSSSEADTLLGVPDSARFGIR